MKRWFGTRKRSRAARPGSPPRWFRPRVEPLEDRLVLAASDWLGSALPLSFSDVLGLAGAVRVAGAGDIVLPPGGQEFFRVDVARSGNLSAELTVSGSRGSLTLYDDAGLPLVRSDGRSPADPSPLVSQGLL